MESHLGPTGALVARKITPPKVGLSYKLRNLPNLWRGWWRWQVAQLCGIPTFYGTLEARVHHADGRVTDYGLISTRSVTDEFVAHLVDCLDGTSTRFTSYDYHDCGTGTTAEAASQTALVTPFGGSRETGTGSQPSANIYRSTATIAFSGTFAITEHGLFSAASATDELLDRSVFSAINVVSGDSISFQYSLTCSSGG